MSFDYGSSDILLTLAWLSEPTPRLIKFHVKVRYVNFRNSSPIRVVANVIWTPTEQTRNAVTAKYLEEMDKYNEGTKHEFRKAFMDAARERIKFASRIEPRPYDELREGERMVVYRSLVQRMLTKGIPLPDDRTRHVISELLNTIFDVDKMLYFVMPEWWRPRMHRSHQALGGIDQPSSGGGSGSAGTSGGGAQSVYSQVVAATAKAVLPAFEDSTVAESSTVSWGGVGEGRADNYYTAWDKGDQDGS